MQVEDATKAVEEQLYDLPATNTPVANDGDQGPLNAQQSGPASDISDASMQSPQLQSHRRGLDQQASVSMSAEMVSRIEANEAKAPFR